MEFNPDSWRAVLAPETPLFELAARGALLYFGILILMRFMPRRAGGELATMDLIFVLLIAEAASHALGEYTSLSDGVMLIIIIIGCNYVTNKLSYEIPLIERLISAPPLQIVRDGQILRRNMRREFITEEELESYMRQQGIDTIEDVKSAYVEAEGKVTVVKKET